MDAVVAEIKAVARPCATPTEIAHVAAISVDNDRSIGEPLARAIDMVGREGAISTEDGSDHDQGLAAHGYRLLGGRLLPGEHTPRAQFMYENAQGARVTLYVAVFGPGQAPDSSAFRSVRVGGEESFYWVDERFGYALSGDARGPDMQALARDVYGQLER